MDNFTFLQLSLNLRNSKEIVRKSKTLAEITQYRNAESVIETPSIFPSGPTPTRVNSVSEGIGKAKQSFLQCPGILVIVNELNDNEEKLQQLRSSFRIYGKVFNDFKIGNPCEYLRNGNILVAAASFLSGFEWS